MGQVPISVQNSTHSHVLFVSAALAEGEALVVVARPSHLVILLIPAIHRSHGLVRIVLLRSLELLGFLVAGLTLVLGVFASIGWASVASNADKVIIAVIGEALDCLGVIVNLLIGVEPFEAFLLSWGGSTHIFIPINYLICKGCRCRHLVLQIRLGVVLQLGILLLVLTLRNSETYLGLTN